MSLRCPKCAMAAQCIDSRRTEFNKCRRRYRCTNKECHVRFTTMEFLAHVGTDITLNYERTLKDELRQEIAAELQAVLAKWETKLGGS